MAGSNSPQKAKKRNKSLFDDDDFFVMKKKKSKPPHVKPEEPKPEVVEQLNTQDTVKDEPTIEHQHGHLPLPLPSSAGNEVPGKLELFGSDDLAESFHTAHNSPGTEDIQEINSAIIVPEATETIEVPSDNDDSDFEFDLVIKANSTKQHNDQEADRLYDFTVLSKLGHPELHRITCKGNETFSNILSRLKDQAFFQYVPFNLTGGCLIWIDGRLELKPFFKPSTLRIPEPKSPGAKSSINCLYIPESCRNNFEQIYEEFQKTPRAESREEEDLTIVEVIGDKKSESPAEEPSESNDGYFVIGLKGKDNKRIEAEVGPQTKIRALLQHYLKSKSIDPALVKKARLVFDDEDLDLDGIVGDTELEEDFEVQVYIN